MPVPVWWPLVPVLLVLGVLLREEPRRNLLEFLSSRPMGPGDDWAETRVKATMAANARILAYANERSERLRLYDSNWVRTSFRVVR